MKTILGRIIIPHLTKFLHLITTYLRKGNIYAYIYRFLLPSLGKSWPVQLTRPLIKPAVNLKPGSVRGGGKEREEQN